MSSRLSPDYTVTLYTVTLTVSHNTVLKYTNVYLAHLEINFLCVITGIKIVGGSTRGALDSNF